MKRVFMAVAAMALCATMSFAQGTGKAPFKADFNKLNTYLELAPQQMDEVSKINDYFIQMQKESFSSNPVRSEKRMHRAVYSNLKLMKGVLDETQYRKYVTLLNVTRNNLMASMSESGGYYFATK